MGPPSNAATRKRTRSVDLAAAGTADDEPAATPTREPSETSTRHTPSPSKKRTVPATPNHSIERPEKQSSVEPNIDQGGEQEEESGNSIFFPFERIANVFFSAAKPARKVTAGSADADAQDAERDDAETVQQPLQEYDNGEEDDSDFATAHDVEAPETHESAAVDSEVDEASAQQHIDQEPPPQGPRKTTKTAPRKKQTAKASFNPGDHAGPAPALKTHRRKTPPTEEAEHSSLPKRPRKRLRKSNKKATQGNDAPGKENQAEAVTEVEPDFDLTAEELLVTTEVDSDGIQSIDKIVDLMGNKSWTAQGNSWIDRASGPQNGFLPWRRKSARRLGRHIAGLTGISLYPSKQRAAGLGEDEISTMAGGLTKIQDMFLPAAIADDWDEARRTEDVARNVIPRAVALLRAFARAGARGPPHDPRLFHSRSSLQILINIVDLILTLAGLINPDTLDGLQQSRDSLRNLCISLKNALVTAKNEIVQNITDVRDAAAEIRRAQQREAAAAVREEEARRAAAAAWRERDAKVQASIQEFLTQKDDDDDWMHEEVEVRPVGPTWDECLRVMKELRGSDHPDLRRMGRDLGCSADDVWDMIDAIKEEAERAEREDGIAIPNDLLAAFATLYE